MKRLLVLAGLAVAVWWALEVTVSRLRSRWRGEPPLSVLAILAGRLLGRQPPSSKASGSQSTALKRCQQCGLHVPEQRALAAADSWFCSLECLELYRTGARAR